MFGYLNTYIDSRFKPPIASVICKNVNLETGVLRYRSYPDGDKPLQECNFMKKYFHIVDGKLYWDDEEVGLPIPPDDWSLSASTSPGYGNVDGTNYYVITYKKTKDGIEMEGAPSDVKEITVDNQKVRIDGLETGYIKRIYRMPPGATEFLFVDEISETETSYEDNKGSDDLGDALSTEDYYPPPDNLEYIFEHNSKLFLVTDNKLYFSKTEIFWAYPPEFFFEFDTTVAGVGIINEIPIVFTENQIYGIYGYDETDFAQRILDTQVGASKDSVRVIDNKAYFVYNDDVYVFAGGNAVKISGVIDDYSIGAITGSGVVDNRYYLVNDLLYDTDLKGFLTKDNSGEWQWKSKKFEYTKKINIGIHPIRWKVEFQGNLIIKIYGDDRELARYEYSSPVRTSKYVYAKPYRSELWQIEFIGDENTVVYSFRLG